MQEFLRYIQEGPGFTEIRAIMHGKVVQYWLDDRSEATERAFALSDEGWDAYFGVLPRVMPQGDAHAVAATADVLWADLDSKPDGDPKSLVLARLLNYDIPPAVIVDSGHGYHAYWKLDRHIPTPRACVIMRGLAKQLHGDHVYDAPRILRVPGTTNWKRPDAPVPVRVLRFDATRSMRPGDFERPERIGWAELEPRRAPVTRYVQPNDREELPQWLVALIEQGAPQGQRSEAAFKVMAHLARRGWADHEIQALFENMAIGEKYREMRSGGQRWLERSLARARQ